MRLKQDRQPLSTILSKDLHRESNSIKKESSPQVTSEWLSRSPLNYTQARTCETKGTEKIMKLTEGQQKKLPPRQK